MQLTGKLTAQEIKDVGRLVRSKWYWPHLLASNFHGVILFSAAIWFVFLSGDREHWRARLGVLSIVIIILGWATFSSLKERRTEIAEMNASLPDVIQINSEGLHTKKTNGARSLMPWNQFKGWRSAGSVILLEIAEVKGFVILPLAALSSTDHDLLRGTIASHLGEATNE